MNIRLLAEALRALANALETPPDSTAVADAPPSPRPAAVAQDAPAASADAPKRPRGRPAKGEAAPATPPSAPPQAASATPSTPAAAATPAPVSSGPLTHALVAKDFTDAAAKHGTAFVKGLLAQYAKGATFDTVPTELLPKIQAALRAGPQAAPAAAETAEDLLG